jgi:acyl transferase domain-containing protein/thioesterase domain-containing protein/acyl carrier protein
MGAYDSAKADLDGADVAIVGMAARVPGARDATALWQNLRDGVESIQFPSDEALLAAGASPSALQDPSYIKACAPIPDLEQFDPSFFRFSKREAAVLDPQHRHFLEVSWEALENAAILPEKFAGAIGVFAGAGMHAYLPYHLFTNPELMRSMGLFLVRHTGNDKDFLATRLSYCLDLHGPAINVQTACSTSLVAVHMAIQSLLSQECDLALAGGVTIELPHHQGYFFQEGEILSPDGHCRPFEARSGGTVFGSGAAVLVLRRLRDAVESGDFIHAIIKGSAVNNDGARKAGYLAPSVEGQADCVAEALQVSGLQPSDISYVECHGTGTVVGDPIELAALTHAFDGGAARQSVGVGSVKSNIGHLDTAAGAVALIKTAQMLQHELLAKTLHFEQPNPNIDFASSPFYVVAENKPWPRGTKPRRAGVSSLGVGGTNAHVIIEEAPTRRASPSPLRAEQLLLVSARSQRGLDAQCQRLAEHLRTEPGIALADVADTLLHARRVQPYIRVLCADSPAAAVQLLEAPSQAIVRGKTEAPPIVFLFPGGGAQFPNMARGVYEREPVFRDAVDRCLHVLSQAEGMELRALLFPEPGSEHEAAAALERPSRSLASLLTIEIAYLRLLASWGVEPAAVLGHSVGEYAAMYAAGAIDLETALAIVCERGRLFERAEPGGMLSVALPLAQLEPLLGERSFIAAINSPELCVVSGAPEDLDALQQQLEAADVATSRLRIAVAAHSALLDPILGDFERFMQSRSFQLPACALISNRTAQKVRAGELDASYFVRHLREPVQFSACLQHVFQAYPGAVLLEVGPGQGLTALARSHSARASDQHVLSVSPHARDAQHALPQLLTSLGCLHGLGARVALDKALGSRERRAVPLPATPWEHERCWIEPGAGAFQPTPHAEASEAAARERSFERWFYTPTFRLQPSAAGQAVAHEHWLILAEPGPLARALVHEASALGVRATLVSPGAEFARRGPDQYTVRLSDKHSFASLLDAQRTPPRRILHALCVSGEALIEADHERPAVLDATFFSLLHLAQALAEHDLEPELELLIATSRAYDVAGSSTLRPLHALVQGPALVIARELPNVRTRVFDLEDARASEPAARALVAELSSKGTGEPLVAERGKRRYAQVLERGRLGNAEDVRAALPDKPVFLFTGGLGDIALSLAKHFASRLGARIALVARTPPQDHPVFTDPAEVLLLSADVTDARALAAAVQRARDHFGRIDVVVHAAGSIDDALLGEKTVESARRVLAPKLAGARSLVSALASAPPTALLFVGSTSALLGPAGQIDYAAANAYLAALARACSPDLPSTRVHALGFGMWREIGMAARSQPPEHTGRGHVHPVLGVRRDRPDGRVDFELQLSPDTSWLLDEHRVRGGSPVLPGTAMLELMRSAFAASQALAPEQAHELTDLVFLAPIAVRNGESVRVLISVSGSAVVLSTRAQHASAAREHAQARIQRLEPGQRATERKLQAIRARCSERIQRFAGQEQQLPQDARLALGPRWNVLRYAGFARDEALAELELDSAFAEDLAGYALHPGLLDIATGFAFALADGVHATAQLRVPLSYGKVSVLRPLLGRVVSHVRLRRDLSHDELAVFDAELMDERGALLVRIEHYATKRIDPVLLTAAPARAAGETFLERFLPLGITPAEGARIVEHVLANHPGPELYASPVPLATLRAALDPKPNPKVKAPTPIVAATSDLPRDEVEHKLAELWQNLLGVPSVGIHDNFFELGGHSLIAVRLFSRIRKLYGIELSLAVLFRAPTIATCAALLRDALKLPAAAAPARGEAEPHWALVPIQLGTTQPFFCVHGAGGNVLNFRDLALRLGKEHTFYGLQARAVNGGAPHERIEDMAEAYVAAIRSVQPRGPYVLGGYSGGGVIAYEMAQQLRAAGEHTATLVMLDTFHPGTVPRKPTLAERLLELRQGGRGYLAFTLKRHVIYPWEVHRIRRLSSQGAPVPIELREVHLTHAFNEACGRYQPKPYPERVTLYRAQAIDACFNHVGPKLGWDNLIARLDVVAVPGDHASLVKGPNAAVLTQHLKKLLQREPGQIERAAE